MGNYLCLGSKNGQQVQDECTRGQLDPPIKVVKPEGGIHVFKRPVTVSELTRLHPDHFVCHSKALITRLTPKAVLPKDVELEAGRLYYILPNSKLLQEQQQQQDPAPNSNLMDHNVIRSGAAAAAAAVKELPASEIKHHSRKLRRQILPGFAQVKTMLSQQDMARAYTANSRSTAAAAAAEDAGHDDVTDESPMISYSTPDLRSMYLNGAPKKINTLARSNSWKPRLETISEVSAYSRRRIQNLVRVRGQKSRSQVHSSL